MLEKPISKVRTAFLGSKQEKKGILPTLVTGSGTAFYLTMIDNVFGGPVQRIFSFNLPIFGPVGPLDIINYVIHAGGLKFSRNGLLAVAGGRISFGLLKNIGPIQLPGTNRLPQVISQGTTVPTPTGGAT